MLNDINIYPTIHEQELLAQKAAQHNMSVQEFILFTIRIAIYE